MGFFDFIKKQILETKPNAIQQSSVDMRIDEKRPSFSAGPQNEIVTSLQNRISRATPSKNGLYPHEILMLDYAKTYKNSKNNFQSFWHWSYSVDDPQLILDSLYQRSFIKKGSVKTNLSKLTVGELKDLLVKISEKTTGKKDDLIARILENYSSEKLEILFPERYFELTEKGEQELLENKYVPYLHRHKYMDVWEMNYLIYNDNPSDLNFRDILWREFNVKSGEHFKNCNFGLYRNVRLNMHDFLLEESKYKTALHMLIEVASFDLSGLGNGDVLDGTDQITKEIRFKHKLTNLFFDDKQEVIIPPGITSYFKKLYELLEISENEFKKYIYEECAEVKIHERVFSCEECANVILSSLNIEERKLKNSKKVAEDRIKRMINL